MLTIQIQIKKHIRVFLDKTRNLIIFQGPLGYSLLAYTRFLFIKVIYDKHSLILGCLFKVINSRSLLGTYRSLIHKRMLGVYQGFFQIINIVGIGWGVSLIANFLVLKLGYSHSIKYKIPGALEIMLFDKQRFKVFGVHYELVKQFSSQLCLFRKPDYYKGKGLCFDLFPLKLKVSSKVK